VNLSLSFFVVVTWGLCRNMCEYPTEGFLPLLLCIQKFVYKNPVICCPRLPLIDSFDASPTDADASAVIADLLN
jgi:hypothetical protein